MIQLLVSVHFYATSSSEPSRMQVRQQFLNECSVIILVFSSKPLRPIVQELMLGLSKKSWGKDFDPFWRLTFPWMVSELTIEGQSCLLELTWAISRYSHAQQCQQGQRRSPCKTLGGENLHLESNPIPTRDAQRVQTNLVCTRTRRKEQWPIRHWPRLAQECLGVSSGGVGQWWPAAGLGGTECSSACMGPFEGGHHYLHCLHLVWPQVNNGEGTQLQPSTENCIKDLLSMALPIRTRPSFPLSQSLSSRRFHKPFIILQQSAQIENHNHRKLTNLITRTTALSSSMKLWTMLCRATQDRWVMVESSEKMWPTGEGDGKPLQYSCLENLTINLQCLTFCLFYAWNVSFESLIFLKRSLVFPILLLSSISLK